MNKIFDGFQDKSSARAELLELEDQIAKLEIEKKDMKKAIEASTDSIGGDNWTETLGKDGELFGMKDKCFSFEAAKYVYDLCLFQRAKQNPGGVHLGDWIGQQIERGEEEQDLSQRVWTWQNGAKCWNGPHRSVEALVTCGVETKILSADEPETCRYVFEVESPIACDAEFRLFHNL